MANGTVKQQGMIVKTVSTSHIKGETIKATLGRVARTMNGISVPTGKHLIILGIAGVPIDAGSVATITPMPTTVSSSGPSELYGVFITATGNDFGIWRAYFNMNDNTCYMRNKSSDISSVVETVETGSVNINYIIV